MAAKLTKNLGPPSSTLHVANLPEDLTHVEVKVSQVFKTWSDEMLTYWMQTCQMQCKITSSKGILIRLQQFNETLTGHVYREGFYCQGVQGVWSWGQHGEIFFSLAGRPRWSTMFPSMFLVSINTICFPGSFDHGKPRRGSQSPGSHAQLRPGGIQGLLRGGQYLYFFIGTGIIFCSSKF